MKMLTAEIARYLAAQGFGVFDPEGIAGDIFVEVLPEANASEIVIALFATGGFSPNAKLPYDRPTVQVRVRGGQNPAPPWEKAQAIWNALQSFSADRFVPGGIWIVDCQAMSSPGASYRDENRRVVYPMNFVLQVKNTESEWRL